MPEAHAKKYGAVIFDYGEVIWMQSRNVHVYKSEWMKEGRDIKNGQRSRRTIN